MATFPVSTDDPEGLVDAVNYLLSGPAGLGQNFAGFSAYTESWLTGNFRTPYSSPTQAQLYVPPVYLKYAEQLDRTTFKFYFRDPQPAPPFYVGNSVYVQGIENNFYDGDYDIIGVIECTTEYVILRTTNDYDVRTPSPAKPNGAFAVTEISQNPNSSRSLLSSDANARVVVDSPTDRVFISAQADILTSYLVQQSAANTLTLEVYVDRWVGGLETDTTSGQSDYRFSLDKTVAAKTYTYTGLTGAGTLPLQEIVFATILDQPPPGYYWYILEFRFRFAQSSLVYSESSQITEVKQYLRCMTTQVVKQ